MPAPPHRAGGAVFLKGEYMLREWVIGVKALAIDWSRQKSWPVRLLLLLWFAYVLARQSADAEYGSVLSWLNLAIHELGHLVFAPLGGFMGILGGTLLQLIAPMASVINFYRQNDFFAICLCFGWLSTNFFDIARYSGDARAMQLTLVSPFGGEGAIHDWNYLLGKMHILQYDSWCAFIFRGFAVFFMLLCLVSGGWLLWQVARNSGFLFADRTKNTG